MIEVKHLTKKIGQRMILEDVNIHVNKGTIYGIIGVNGAGKTTLIRHLIGSYIPDDGQVLIDGQPVFENNHIKEKIVYIPDEFPTSFGSNIREIAKFYSRIYPSWSEVRYQQLISRFQQNELANFNQFSKGMKKQVSFILALSIMPDYLIMDEPFDGLDPLIRQTIWDILIQDVSERNMTIFISSHHLKELDAMCETICLIDHGKVIFEYKIDDLKHKIHKVQVAFHSEMMKDKARTDLHLLNEVSTGKIQTWIVEGNMDEIIEKIENNNPLILETLPLDLEEIFTFALGGDRHVLEEVFGTVF